MLQSLALTFHERRLYGNSCVHNNTKSYERASIIAPTKEVVFFFASICCLFVGAREKEHFQLNFLEACGATQ